MQVDGISYTQNLKDGKVDMEFLSYTSRETSENLTRSIYLWFKRENIKYEFSKTVGHITLDGSRRDIFDWNAGKVNVMLHGDEDGTSWIHFSNRINSEGRGYSQN